MNNRIPTYQNWASNVVENLDPFSRYLEGASEEEIVKALLNQGFTGLGLMTLKGLDLVIDSHCQMTVDYLQNMISGLAPMDGQDFEEAIIMSLELGENLGLLQKVRERIEEME